MKHIIQFSGGKDSTAMLLRMIELNMQIDEIIFIDTTKDYEEMYEYIIEVENYIKRPIKKVQSELGWDGWFYRVKQKGKHKGMIYGFPKSCGQSWCTKHLKIDPANKSCDKGDIIYLGIAFDEQQRIQKQKTDRIEKYPLIEWGWTEKDCKEYLIKKDMLNPLYKYFDRLGCRICPKMKKSALRNTWKYFPKYWDELKRYEADSPHPFRTDLKVSGFERLFQIEEENKPEVNKPSLSQKNTKEDGFPPTPKSMGIQPTIL